MRHISRRILAGLLALTILGVWIALPAGAEGVPVTVEGSKIYANGIPISIYKEEDGVWLYNAEGTQRLYSEPLPNSLTIYGGGKNADVDGGTYVVVGEGVSVYAVYGGGYSDGTHSANFRDDTYVRITSSLSPRIYGGGYAEGVKGEAAANVGGSAVLEIVSTAVDAPSAPEQEGVNPTGGGYALARTYGAEANVAGSVTVREEGGFIHVARGGGNAQAGGTPTATANCGGIFFTVDGGNTRELYSGGYASGAGATANVESVTAAGRNQAIFAVNLYGGGSASQGGTALTGPVSLNLADCEIQAYLYGGGKASEGGTADVGDVSIRLKDCAAPAEEQWGRMVSALILGGGDASGAGSSAKAGTVDMTVDGGESAGQYVAGGYGSSGGDASTGDSFVKFGNTDGNMYEGKAYYPAVYSRVEGGDVAPFDAAACGLKLTSDQTFSEIGVLNTLDLGGYELRMDAIPEADEYLDSSTEKTGQFYYNGTPMFVARIGDICYGSFSDAMSAVQPGGAVTLFPGKFSTRLTIDKSVSIRGAAEYGTVLTGGIDFGKSLAENSPEGMDVTIDGIAFEGKGIDITAWGQTPGLPEAQSVCIQNNIFRNIDGAGSHYAIHINNGDEGVRNLTIRNNTFDGTGTESTDAAGGVFATVCGALTVTGNTFRDMAFNSLTLTGKDGTGNAADSVTIADNVFDGWGRYTDAGGIPSGRAMRLSNFAAAADLTGNKFTCAEAPEEYIKITDSEPPVVSGCYWDGKSPSDAGVIEGGFTSENYYLRPTMLPSDLNDYQAPPQGVAGGLGTLTGLDAAMEYSADRGENWTACGGTEITGLAAGEYWVRYAKTDLLSASDHVAVAVGGWSVPPDDARAVIAPERVTLPYHGAVTLTASAGSNYTYQWQVDRDGNGDWTALEGGEDRVYTLPRSEVNLANSGRRYRCRITNTEPGLEPSQGVTNAVTLVVVKGTQDAPEGVTGGVEQMTGVTAAMEYSADQGRTWTACGGTAIAGLKAGEYWVRYGETETLEASPHAVVSVSAHSTGGAGGGGAVTPPPQNTVTTPNGTTTTTVTEKDGTVTETVKTADGLEARRVTDPDGKVTASADVPKEGAKALVVLPIAPLPVVKEAEQAPELTVKTERPVTVAVPMETHSPGMAAIIVKADGTQTLVRGSVAVDGVLRIPLEAGAVLRLVDRSTEFLDTEEADWARDAVDFVSSHELLQGTGDGNFSPHLPMDRGMLAVVLNRLDNDAKAETAPTYADVPEDAYYAQAAAWAAEKGVMAGTGEGFAPDAAVTREQLAAVLYRYVSMRGPVSERADVSGFLDSADLSDWAREAMDFTVGAGLITGRGDGVLDPKGCASRAEAAVILRRLAVYLTE